MSVGRTLESPTVVKTYKARCPANFLLIKLEKHCQLVMRLISVLYLDLLDFHVAASLWDCQSIPVNINMLVSFCFLF